MHRFAVGVDMPPAKVEGIQDANHWNAWALDKEALEHLAPVAVDFANDIASAYLRPTLRKDKVEDWDKYLVWYDDAEAVSNPDNFNDALKLYEARAVGKKYLREAGNATDTDAMTDEELQEALLVQTNQLVDVERRPGRDRRSPSPSPTCRRPARTPSATCRPSLRLTPTASWRRWRRPSWRCSTSEG